ncbi:MAG: hypothetical protein OHK0052_05810 [Anaerolineales bacterium]
MKKFIGLLFLVVLMLAVPARVLAAPLHDDRVIVGSDFTLAAGETLSGNLVIIGGDVTLEAGSIVTGDVALLGGQLTIAGQVNGEIVATGGTLTLEAQANIGGNVMMTGTTVTRDPQATLGGEFLHNPLEPLTVTVPGQDGRLSAMDLGFGQLLGLIWFFFRSFMFAALAVLLLMLFPLPNARAARAIAKQPLMAGMIGILTLVAAPLLLVFMAITLILLPVALLGVLVFVVILAISWVALGFELGNRIAKLLNQNWADAVNAGVGTLALSLVAGGFGETIPCVGWIVPILAVCLGLGAIVLTRFGTQEVSEMVTIPQPPSAAP